MKKRKRKRASTPAIYHHGDLRNALLDAARNALEKKGLEGVSLRAVAREAGVSHSAPYRHFPNHDALLVELAVEGFEELRRAISAVAAGSEPRLVDRITGIGAAYMRFVAQKPELMRLMFSSRLPPLDANPNLRNAADALGTEIGIAVEDPILGLAVWASAHGLAMLVLKDVADLGQRRSGNTVLPSRAEVLLRSLFTVRPDP